MCCPLTYIECWDLYFSMFGVSTFIIGSLQSFKILEWWENHNIQHQKKHWFVRVTTTNGYESHYSISLSTFLFEELLHLGKNKRRCQKVQRIFFPKKWAQVATLWGKKKIIDHISRIASKKWLSYRRKFKVFYFVLWPLAKFG